MSTATTSAPTASSRMRRRNHLWGVRIRHAALVAVLCLGVALHSSPASDAAGITTHGWMAIEAIDHVTNPQLRALLESHIEQVRAGASFPDVGYVGGNTYGEEAHWQRFVDAYLTLIENKPGCGDLTDKDGPCADLVAHAFGVAAHGMGDETWDWLFEPYGPDLDEYYVHPDVPTANEGGAETQMDLVAIGRYGVPRPATPPLPDAALLVQAFQNSGMTGVDASQFSLVPSLPILWDVEKGWSDAHLADVEAAMPWMSANMVTAPGGVNFSAKAIAGYWSSMWGRLTGNPQATTVSVTYPAPGQTGVPDTGWDRDSFQPGSSRGRGGALNRITAVLTSSRPYRDANGGGGVPQELPVGSMMLYRVSDNAPVALKAGYPRSVPYGADAGEHLIDVQPAANLDRCTWYRVDVSTDASVLDAQRLAVTPYSWTFQTECDDVPPVTTAPPTTVTPTTTPPTTTPPTTAPPTTTVTAVAPSTTVASNRDHNRTPNPLPTAVPAVPVVADPAYTG